MNGEQVKVLLEAVKAETVSIEEAAEQLGTVGFDDLGFAKVDLDRKERQGFSEVIYGEGKSAEQIIGICRSLLDHGQKNVLITRLSKEKAACLEKIIPLTYEATARVGILGERPEPDGEGIILVATAGTSDLPIAEEAAITAEMLGNEVVRLYDVGVAGIHRTLAHLDLIQRARAIIVVAGMEGALASVIGGLASCPVVAVPTSVGYGASFGGVAALLSMLNSCASGVAVVNIDNGFGAACFASKVNH